MHSGGVSKGRFLAVAVHVSGMWQVTGDTLYMTSDTWHLIIYVSIYLYIIYIIRPPQQIQCLPHAGFSANRPNRPIRSSSRNVRPYPALFVCILPPSHVIFKLVKAFCIFCFKYTFYPATNYLIILCLAAQNHNFSMHTMITRQHICSKIQIYVKPYSTDKELYADLC